MTMREPMKVENLYHIYTLDSQKSFDFKLRDTIQEALFKGDQINRFRGEDLPPNVILDTVFTHTLRACSLVNYLDIDPSEKELTANILLLHDLPEVISVLNKGQSSDITSLQKEIDPSLDELVAREEMDIATTIFNNDELSLYIDFEESGLFLKGKSNSTNTLTKAGVIAQLIDKCDANLKLHFSLSSWVCSQEYDPELLIPNRSLTYAFRQYEKFMPQVFSLEQILNLEKAIAFYPLHIEAIKNMWNKIHQKGIKLPQELLYCLS